MFSTWVPPQSSREKPGTSITRTSSPYFSPKSATAPISTASFRPMVLGTTGVLFAISALTRASTRATSSLEGAPGWVKSNLSPSGPTPDPAWRTCPPSTLARAACSRWVAVWWPMVRRRASPSTARTHSAPSGRPGSASTTCATRPSTGAWASTTRRTAPSGPLISPVSPRCPPPSA